MLVLLKAPFCRHGRNSSEVQLESRKSSDIYHIDLLEHLRSHKMDKFQQQIDQPTIDHSWNNNIASFLLGVFFRFYGYLKRFIEWYENAIKCLCDQSNQSQYQTIYKLLHGSYDNNHKLILEFFSPIKPLLLLLFHTHQFHRYTAHWSLEDVWILQIHQLIVHIQ